MAPVVGLRRVGLVTTVKMTGGGAARYAVVFYRRRQRRFKLRRCLAADIQRQRAVGARGWCNS